MIRFNPFKSFRASNLLFLGLLLSFSTFLLSGCLESEDINEEEEFRKQQEAYLKQLATDTMLIKQYLADNQITNAKRTASGLFYVEQEVGLGKKPVSKKQVTTQYTLRAMQGNILDQGTFSFVLDNNEAVAGFNQGVALMRVGGRSVLYVPSGLGYGSKGSGKIGPNQNLIFEVALIEAKQ